MSRAGVVLPFVEFCRRVLGVRLETGQRVLWSVVADGIEPSAFDGAERDTARRIFGQVDTVPPGLRHTIAVVKGARSGFSYVGALRLLHLALTVPLPTLAPGEVAAAIIVAPDLRLARQAYRYALGAAKECPAVRDLVESESTDAFVLRRPDGKAVSIECLPATVGGRATRGRTLVGALLDEASFFRSEDSAVVNDAEVYRGVAPRVVQGGQVLIGSTPWVEGVGLLATLYAQNHGKPSTALAAYFPTSLARTDATILSIVERERKRDPENAAREYDGIFLPTGSGAFFDAAAIQAAIDESLVLPVAYNGGVYFAGSDFGFTRDSSALVIVDSAAMVADITEVRPAKGAPLKPSRVGADFRARCADYRVHKLMADAHSREAMREHLAPVELVDAPAGQPGKARVYIRSRELLNEGKVKIPNHPRLIQQLREVVAKPLPGGGLSISSPRWRLGGHGDIVSAWTLALWGASPSRKHTTSVYVSQQAMPLQVDSALTINTSDLDDDGRPW